MWRANGAMENMPREQSTKISFGTFKESDTQGISNIDNFVKHIYREHNEEADHWADIGAQGRRKFDIYRKDGFWDGSFKDDGRSGCGIVIDDNQHDRSSFESECRYGGGSSWCMRAHECPRSDPVQKPECTEHQSTKKPDPSLLTDHAF